jgi:hypothetical protein
MKGKLNSIPVVWIPAIHANGMDSSHLSASECPTDMIKRIRQTSGGDRHEY